METSKGRTTGYSDYFKSRSKSPDGSFAEEDEAKDENTLVKKITSKDSNSKDSAEEDKKAAIRRRLLKRKAVK